MGSIATVSAASVSLGLTLGSGMVGNQNRIVLIIVALASALVLLFVGSFGYHHHWFQ